MISQLFVQLHPHAACAPMHRHFAEHYHAAPAAVLPGPLAIAAVA